MLSPSRLGSVCRFVVPVALVTLSCLSAASGEITPLQVVMTKTVAGVFPSPDGQRVAFLRAEPRGPEEEPGGAFSVLYILDAGAGERRLTGEKKNVGGIAWTVDGQGISFLEKREGDKQRQIYVLPMSGGEPNRLFEAPEGVIEYRWRPDGGAIAFTANVPEAEARTERVKKGFKQVVVDEDWRPVGLFLWDASTGGIRPLVEEGAVGSLEWAPDGSRLAFAWAPRALVDDEYMFSRIHLADLKGGGVARLVDNPGKLGSFSWSPDSQRIAYISAVDRNDPHAGSLFVVDVASRQVTALTQDWQGMVHEAHWEEPQRLRLRISRGVESAISDFDLARRSWSDYPTGALAFEGFQSGGETLAAVVSTPQHPSEVYLFEAGQWRRRTDSNPWLEGIPLARQEVVRYAARDGLEIEGILMFPSDFSEGRRYPLVIVAHGGPESHFNNGWLTSYSNWGQLLAQRGMFVWYPNYRASTGRGVEFAKADHGDPMGAEFEDHLDAIAFFVDKGWVDRERVGIGGGSYGGYTAAWAATRHSEHFAAAVSFVPIVDVPTKWYTSDIPWEFYYVHYQEKWPHEQMDFLRQRSPLTYAPNCNTPLLVLGGTSDTRIHPSQPFMLYRAVKTSTKTPVRYVQYPGEGHGNRTNVYRYDYCVRSLQWFEHYLQPGRQNASPPAWEIDYSGWK